MFLISVIKFSKYHKKISDKQGLGFSLKYFSLGEINLTGEQAQSLGNLSPNEFAVDGGYALKLSENLSMGVALRYIFSNLNQASQVTVNNTKPGQSFASDLGVYYKSRKFNLPSGQKANYALGLLVSNVGAKITYSDDANADFIPTNLRLGATYTISFDEYNSMSFTAETNKLLVPTPPIRDDAGNIIQGKDDDVGSFAGIFQSFNDAPGGGQEELREFIWNGGAEYNYDDKFFLRGGYQYEHETKGNRKYFTLGLGLKYNVFGLDFAYLIPATPTVRSPLENTLRFTLFFGFGDSSNE